MELTIYDIIKGPIVTDKAYLLNKKLKQLVLSVHMAANKILIKQALETLFDVKVEKVRIIIRKGKNKLVLRKKVVTGSDVKKAIITLKEGYSIDLTQQGSNAMTDVAQTHDIQAA